MKSSTMKWSLAVTTAALLMLPPASEAQTPPASQAPATQPPAASQQQPATSAQPSAAAQEHLAKATSALNDIKTATLDARAKAQIAELKRRLNTLERTVAANDKASATGTAARSPQATSGARGNANWGTEVAAIDKTLTTLLGPESATGADTPTATGTTGSAASKSKAAITLDEPTRAALTEVRTHITAFATAMAGGQPPASSTEPTADPSSTGAPSSATPSSTAPATSTPPASPTPTTPQSASPAGTTPPAQTNPQAGAQAAQPDEHAARRHLTDARNTLSAMTQLPAASQLSGEARAQVSQLISNFNELITTQSEWRGSYAKVSANLTSLLGPDTGTTDPSSATGTAGAVGTSGAATPALDPTVRAKLVELRQKLNEFEKAAGGTAATATPASPATDPTTATSPTMTAPATAAPGATTPGMTASGTAPAAQGTTGTQSMAGNADVMRHMAAIEGLLKLEDESGGLTLTKAQVEQLRTHWAALRQALNKQ